MNNLKMEEVGNMNMAYEPEGKIDLADRANGLMASIGENFKIMSMVDESLDRLEERLQVFMVPNKVDDQKSSEERSSASEEPPAIDAIHRLRSMLKHTYARVNELADRVYP
jgi:hypothetical protein